MTTTPESFVTMLTGGHPNSLGRTLEVVELILADSSRLAELYRCYFDDDEVVRLRTSNAMKRISREHPEWLIPYLDGFITDIAQINQASTQWTLALLFLELEHFLTAAQKQRATALLQHNLATSHDWIVLNNTMETLTSWAKQDSNLRIWLQPHLERLIHDSRKSVSGRAKKLLQTLTSEKS